MSIVALVSILVRTRAAWSDSAKLERPAATVDAPADGARLHRPAAEVAGGDGDALSRATSRAAAGRAGSHGEADVAGLCAPVCGGAESYDREAEEIAEAAARPTMRFVLRSVERCAWHRIAVEGVPPSRDDVEDSSCPCRPGPGTTNANSLREADLSMLVSSTSMDSESRNKTQGNSSRFRPSVSHCMIPQAFLRTLGACLYYIACACARRHVEGDFGWWGCLFAFERLHLDPPQQTGLWRGLKRAIVQMSSTTLADL